MLRSWVATDFGSMHLSPVLGDFLMQFPDVSVNKELENRYTEMISEGYDVAICVGEMDDSSLRARKIAETTIRMFASPGYIQRAGRPRRIEALDAHKLLHFTSQANGALWKMTSQTVKKKSNL